MASTNAEVSSEALIELKNSLNSLAKALHELFDTMNADMSALGSEWRDSKYEDFVAGYQPQIRKCDEIATRYEEWIKQVLDDTIEKAMAIEQTDVSGDGGGSLSGTTGGASSSGSSASAKIDAFKQGMAKLTKGDKLTISQIIKAKKDSDSGPDSSGRVRVNPGLFNGRSR